MKKIKDVKWNQCVEACGGVRNEVYQRAEYRYILWRNVLFPDVGREQFLI